DRYSGIIWGDKNTAIAMDYWWNTRNTRTYVFDPSNSKKAPKILFDRNYQDRYSDPGSFVTEKNDYGQYVLKLSKNNTFLMGDGFTPEGQFPFVDKLDLKSGETDRLYQSKYNDKKETLVDALNIEEG
ncbi:S9 family peptidase, partial [Tamlana crocina]|nr:S9 family peptidase [Tamlana crocina]